MDDVPPGAENKNRYRNILPSKCTPQREQCTLLVLPDDLSPSSDPHTRVPLFLKFGVANSDYINANYIRVSAVNYSPYRAVLAKLIVSVV